MENSKNINTFNSILKIINSKIFLFLILIKIKTIFLGYFDSFETNTLNEAVSFIDITDYLNLFPIITTDKKIYTGIPPVERSTTNSKIISISSAITYNNNYFLMACTEDYLLSKINVETGNEIPLVP